MPRDRTTEFNPSESPDLELGVLSEEMEQLKEFFDTVDGVNVELLQIRKLVDNIEEFHIKNLSAVSEEQSARKIALYWFALIEHSDQILTRLMLHRKLERDAESNESSRCAHIED